MDSPPDLSSNPPTNHYDDPNNHLNGLQPPPAPASSVSAEPGSTEGSVDSSGFEKVDHDVLEEYGQQFVNQMQQALFGKLPDVVEDDLELDAGFLLVGRSSFRVTDREKVHLLEHTSDNIHQHHVAAQADEVDKNPNMSSTHDDVLEKSYGDLIDIPKNDPHPEPPKPNSGEQQLSNETKSDSPLKSIDSHGDAPHDVHDPKPEEPKTVDTKTIDTKTAHDHFQHVVHDDVPFEPVGHGGVPLDHLIEDQVAEVHGDVDEILHRVQETDERKSEEQPSADVSKDVQHAVDDYDADQPDFRSQTPDTEETTLNRHGPLTIPEIPEKTEIPSEDISALDHDDHLPAHGFETQPRPPTPPKDISEENVKPSAFSLAHTSHTPTHTHHDGLHSILKQSSVSYSGSKEPWIDLKTIDPRILDLLYWRDPKRSAVALSLILLGVFILAKYPIISVIAYSGLGVLAATLGFRIYKIIESQIKKTSGENPFHEYLSKDLTVPQDRIHAQVDVLAEHATLLANQLKRLFFVESIIDSAKFGLILWALTYIGYWFSGLFLVVLAVLSAFSIPKIYEMYQEPIDAQLAMITEQAKKISQMAENKLPFLKKVEVEGEKKEQ